MNFDSQIFKPTNQQISTSLSGESVILNHNKGEYFSLNEVGTCIWNQLNTKAVSLNELVEAVQNEFEIEDVECRKDVEQLLTELINEGLVEAV